MVLKRSALVPRTQRKKLELNPSYGYGAMSKNASKCTMPTLPLMPPPFMVSGKEQEEEQQEQGCPTIFHNID